MGIFEKLYALAGMAQLNALDTIDSGYRCCEFWLTGSPQEFAAEVTQFIDLRCEAAAIGSQAYHIIHNTHHQQHEPRIVRKRAA